MHENPSYFERHRSSIIIIIAALIVAAVFLVWLGVLKERNSSNNGQTGSLTPPEIQLIANDVGEDPPTLTADEQSTILKDNGSGSGTLTAEEKEKILNDYKK